MKKECNIRKRKRTVAISRVTSVAPLVSLAVSHFLTYESIGTLCRSGLSRLCVQAQRVNVQALGFMRGSQLCRCSTKSATDSMQLVKLVKLDLTETGLDLTPRPSFVDPRFG